MLESDVVVDLEGFEYFSEYEEAFDWEWNINPDVMDVEETVDVMITIAVGMNLVGAVRREMSKDER